MAGTLTVVPVPLFEDNYCWRLDNDAHRTSLLVDPADPAAVWARGVCAEHEVVGVLVTHHHADHSGGSETYAARGLPVVSSTDEEGRVKGSTRLVADGERFELGGLSILALHTPFHTRGHVCYFVDGDGERPPAVFTGDALFAGGCGRFFEGDAAQAHGSLAKLSALPPATRVYCGHEYTVSNLRFCVHVEPANAATLARLQAATQLREKGEPTLPSTIAEELATNVFLRCTQPAVVAFTHPEAAPGAAVDPVEVLQRLRQAKNAFK